MGFSPFSVDKLKSDMPLVYSLACRGSGKSMRFCLTVSQEADRCLAQLVRGVFERYERPNDVVYILPLRLLRNPGMMQQTALALQEIFIYLCAVEYEEPLPGHQTIWIDYWYAGERVGGCPVSLWVMPTMSRWVAQAGDDIWRVATSRMRAVRCAIIGDAEPLLHRSRVGSRQSYYDLNHHKLMVSTSAHCSVSPDFDHLTGDPMTTGYRLVSQNTDTHFNQFFLLMGIAVLESLARPGA